MCDTDQQSVVPAELLSTQALQDLIGRENNRCKEFQRIIDRADNRQNTPPCQRSVFHCDLKLKLIGLDIPLDTQCPFHRQHIIVPVQILHLYSSFLLRSVFAASKTRICSLLLVIWSPFWKLAELISPSVCLLMAVESKV